MTTTTLARPERGTGVRYYGWRIVVFSAIALGMTAPGQTVGVSVFIDPMMASLDVSRSQVSMAYLVGTLAGAGTMPAFGRLLDRRGVRFTMTVVVLAFAAVLTAMSGVVGLVTLTLGFVGIRMLGQGALSMVSTTSVAYWFDRQRGQAVGITSAVGQGFMTIAPLSLAAAIGWLGWRGAWLAAAGVVAVVALTIARFGMRDGPADVGQRVDGQAASADVAPVASWGMDRETAVRRPMFWALAGGVFATGLISTALSFHQISILGERGLTTIEAAANFIPQTVAALVATLATGALVDRIRPRIVLAVSMATLAGSILVLPLVSPGWVAALYGAAIGAAGGSARSLEAAAVPRLFGTLHLGALRGLIMAVSVVGTAVGPYLVALGHSMTGSYLPPLRLLLLLPVGVVLLGFAADTTGATPSRSVEATSAARRP